MRHYFARLGLSAVASCFALIVGAAIASPAWAETRLGLVIGNANYPDAPVKTAANDGALVAETLRSVGFDVSEGRDLDQTSMRRVMRDFVEKIDAAGDETVVFVYFAGHALQFAGANYLIPVDARLQRPADLGAETIMLNTLLGDLAGSKSKTRFVVIDGASPHPFVEQAKLARGPALATPTEGALIAFSSSGGEAIIEAKEDYGVYAQALLEMLREPGLSPDEIFNRIKLRVHEKTKGANTPMHASAIPVGFHFLERAESAPNAATQQLDPRTLPMNQLDPATAYAVAIERDTLKAYQEFVALFPNDPLAKKVRARIAQKREALAWRRATQQRTREAYWTYRRWYPRGPHFEDAGYELTALAAPLAAPAGFVDVVWEEVPPPVGDEIAYFEEALPPALAYIDIAPPPPPLLLLPAPIYYAPPPPPAAPTAAGLLPLIGLAAIPAIAVLPKLVRPAPPRPTFPGVRPPVAIAPQPVLINPPGRPGRGALPGQIPGQVAPGGARLLGPGQLPGQAVPPQPQRFTSPGQIPLRAAPPSASAPSLAPPGVAPALRPQLAPPATRLAPSPRQIVRTPPKTVRRQPQTQPEIIRPRGLANRPQVGPSPIVRPPPQPFVRQPPPVARQAPFVVQQPSVARPALQPTVRQPSPVMRQPPLPVARAPSFQPRPQPAPQQRLPRCGPGQAPPACAR